MTQPGRPRGRGNRRTPEPSPVEAAARDLGLQDDRILAPAKANEVLAPAAMCVLEPGMVVVH